MLDKTRSYGVIYGRAAVMYEQDGIEYKANGQPVETPVEPEVAADEDQPTPPKRTRGRPTRSRAR